MTVYSNRLAGFDERDVLSALQRLADAKREEYEPGLPEIGAMLKLVEVERIARDNRSEATKSQRLVRWQCPECGATKCGFPNTSDALERRCDKIKRDGKPTPDGWPICAARMDVIFDENVRREDRMVPTSDLPHWLTKHEERA